MAGLTHRTTGACCLNAAGEAKLEDVIASEAKQSRAGTGTTGLDCFTVLDVASLLAMTNAKQRTGGKNMTSQTFNPKFDRRTLIKGAAALGALQVASPFIIQARGETAIRIGMVDPLTGVYAAPAGNEVMGAKLAVEQMNAKGGILGRQVELLVEDSANDVGTGVQKARKLIERDQVNF